ncbi:MAG: hypothetical protein ABI718_08745 [Acidobacteriota bacterium]
MTRRILDFHPLPYRAGALARDSSQSRELEQTEQITLLLVDHLPFSRQPH